MNRPRTLILILALASAPSLQSQLLQTRFVTSAYGWQRADSGQTAQTHLFAFQSIQLSVASEKISFRTYLQGFNDFGTNGSSSLRLYNFFVKARELVPMVDLQAGRFYVFSGAGRGLIDGATVTVRPGPFDILVTGTYGILSPTDRRFAVGSSDDNLMGIQVTGRPVPVLHALVGYARKELSQESFVGLRSDTLFNPYVIEFNPASRVEEIVGGELRYDKLGLGDAFLKLDYDVGLEAMSRFNAFGRFHVLENLSITGEYLRREPRISYQSIFSVFSYSTIEDVSAGAEYGLTKDWRLLGNYGYVSYGVETAQRVTLGVNGEYVSASFSKNVSSRQDLDAVSLNAGYPMLDKLVTPTLLLSYARYTPDGKTPLRDAVGLAAGAVVRPTSAFLVDAQLQWMNNRIYRSDMRFFVRASYLLTSRLNMF